MLWYTASDRSAEAECARRAATDLEAWEARRRGRCVRLWAASLEVRVPALDRDDARWRLTGFLYRPRHRIDEAAVLCSTGKPQPDSDDGSGSVGDRYPWEALRYRHDRAPFGLFEQAHVDSYLRALAAGRAHALTCSGIPARRIPCPGNSAPSDPRLSTWWVRHRVLFLAGPGEAPARAAELAATIVNYRGTPLAQVVGLTPEDGSPGAEGRWIHPVCALGQDRVEALWDDYDAAESDAGEPQALAGILARAATHIRGIVAAEAYVTARSEIQ